MARRGQSDLIRGGSLWAKTFRSGAEGYTLSLYAEEVEALLKDFPDVRYLRGIVVEAQREGGPDYNVLFFPDQSDRAKGAPAAPKAPARGARDEEDEEDPFGAPEKENKTKPPVRGRRRSTR